MYAEDFIVFYIVGVTVWAVIWGFVTKAVNENKGYYGGFWWGFWLGFIGLIVVACKPENRSFSYGETDSFLSAAARESDRERVPTNGEWKCGMCGRINPSYTGTCGCGKSKTDAEARNQVAIDKVIMEDNKNKKSQQEFDNIKKIKEYKELLDLGIISQDEFDAKKKQLLGL